MNMKNATLAAGAVAVLATAVAPVGANATPAASEPAVPPAASFAELLQPIPNATARLQRADAEEMQAPPQLILAQYHNHNNYNNGYNNHNHNNYNNGYNGYNNHHHHHHNRRWYLSHGYYFYGGQWVLRPRRHHHHHHHNY